MYQTDSTSTSVKVSGITNGAEYFFIVAGIDTGNRVGASSLPSELITFDGKMTQLDILKAPLKSPS